MKRKKKKTSLFDICNVIFMLLILVVTLYPLYFTVIASFSEARSVANGDVIWKPINFTTVAYKYVFEYKQIWVGYKNTVIYAVCGTLWQLCVMIPAAYAMSKKYLPYRKFLTMFFLITMYFGGGLVPTYLLIQKLGLLNTRAVLIIGGISVYNMIVTKTFFMSSIPVSLYEAAEIDGASEFKRFISIALPLAKAIIAVMALYNVVGQWNSYFSAMIYIDDKKLEPLQTVLRRVLIQNQTALSKLASEEEVITGEELKKLADRAYVAYTMKYAMVFISSLPLLIAYPFMQKYFAKGVMIGSIKE